MTDYGWDDIREQLSADIQVWYVKDETVNRKRESQREQTIDWIIERMQMKPQLGGSRKQMPEFTWIFGNLWNPIAKAMRMRYPVCMICGKHGTVEIHHIRPRAYGGTNDPANLIGLCTECHDEVHRRLDKAIQLGIKTSLASMYSIQRV